MIQYVLCVYTFGSHCCNFKSSTSSSIFLNNTGCGQPLEQYNIVHEDVETTHTITPVYMFVHRELQHCMGAVTIMLDVHSSLYFIYR